MAITRRDFLRVAAMSCGAASLPLQAGMVGAQQTLAEPKGSMYLAFPDSDRDSVRRRIAQLGGRTASPNGARRYAISVHINPIADAYTLNSKAREYPIDEQVVLGKLRFLSAMGHPVVLSIFAGKFTRSALTDYLVGRKQNLMRDQHGRLMGPGVEETGLSGDMYFAFAPHIESSPQYPNGYTNHFLRLYERNTRKVARLVARECARDRRLRSLIRVVSIAGEMKYPLFRSSNGERRWADYGPFAVHGFRSYVKSRIGAGREFRTFKAYKRQMRIGAGEMPGGGLDELDPPRGTRRYGWDRLDTKDNPYFMDWVSYRMLEITRHIRGCVRWCQEEGLRLDAPAHYYSHQALFLSREEKYWRLATLKTLCIPGSPNPGVSLYDETTANGKLMASVRGITQDFDHKGRWYSGEYNPKGPKRARATDSNKGYPVAAYLDRLHLAENRGCRGISVSGWRVDEPLGIINPDFTVRKNFMVACERFMRGA